MDFVKILFSRTGLSVIAVAITIGTAWIYGVSRYNDGKNDCKIEIQKKELQGHEKLQKLRDNRSDISFTVNSLRNGEF